MKRPWIYLLTLLAVAGQLAHAHSELLSSVPNDADVLASSPKEVMLDFSEPVKLTALSVERSGEAKQALGPLPTEATQHFAVAAPVLGPGEYVVNWRALSEDTHVMSGVLHFTVGASH